MRPDRVRPAPGVRRQLEPSGEVQQGLLGLGLDPVRDRTGRRVDPRHPGTEDHAAGDDRPAQRAGSCARRGSFQPGRTKWQV
jgi:hypothetical protein